MSDDHKKLCIEQGKQIAMLESELARVRDDNHKQWRRAIKLENDVMHGNLHLVSVTNDYQKKIDSLAQEVERLKGEIEQAFMAGQIDAGIDPSFASAQEYVNKQGEGKG